MLQSKRLYRRRMFYKATVDLPLHSGKCPPWLFERMVSLSRSILLIIYQEFGKRELLRRLSDPLWFQAFGCLLGFDWHSSGLTTTVCGAVKKGLEPFFHDLGLYICGGKGRTALSTPVEIERWACRAGLASHIETLVTLSRLIAKIDNNALQDGFQLYFHLFVFTNEGDWAVIQQGMDETSLYARRYHWASENTVDLYSDPHKGILSCVKRDEVLNLVSSKSEKVRKCVLDLLRENPEKILKEITPLFHRKFPEKHRLDRSDLLVKNIRKVLIFTYERPPKDFGDLLLIPKLGARALRALTLTAEVIYNVKACREDPAIYAYAHGGKDGHPYRLNREIYDRTIRELELILQKMKEGTLRENLLKRLSLMFKF